MAMIHLKEGGTFFGTVKDYDWKGKFLVVTLPEIIVENEPEIRIISWDNIESVYDTEYNKEGFK
jgi:hypothetical protein